MDTLFIQVGFDMNEIYLLKYIKAAMFWQFLSIKFSAVWHLKNMYVYKIH